MSKAKAIILGFFTILPIFYIIFFISFIFSIFMNITNDSSITPELMFSVIFPLHISIMAIIVILMIIYIRDVFHNTSIESDKRTLWAIVLFFGSTISMIVYWIVKIWIPLIKKNKNLTTAST